MPSTKRNFLRYMVINLIEKNFFGRFGNVTIRHYFSKFSKLRAKSTFFRGFDLKIEFLGSFYPYPELGLKKSAKSKKLLIYSIFFLFLAHCA
jgi:hypothetical protein